MSLTAPVAAGTKIAGVKNADGEEVQSARLVMGAAGDTPVSSAAPLPVQDAALAVFVDGLEGLLGGTNAALAQTNGVAYLDLYTNYPEWAAADKGYADSNVHLYRQGYAVVSKLYRRCIQAMAA